MTVNHWKKKFNEKADSELKTLSGSSGHQEAARIVAIELLNERGITIELDNQ